MDKTLKRFLEFSKETHNTNIKKQNEKNEQQKREKEEKEKEMQIKRMETLTYNQESPSVKRILELGFQINSYHKQEHPYGREYYGDMDVFYCEYKEWMFTIDWSADPDIDEGILALREPKNKVTGQELNFYCDLFCNNTGKERLDNILAIFDIGYDNFINFKYGKFIELPKLLKQQGYNVKTVDYIFEVGENEGYIDVGDGVFLKVYRAWYDDMKMVVTNNPKWDVNSNNSFGFNNEMGYYFEYENRGDLSELCKCINAFKEHMEGKHGFKETIVKDGGIPKDIYYHGDDFLKIFSTIKTTLKKKYYDKWNSHFLRYDVEKKWDSRGYDEEPKYENHYTGLEIHETVLFSINDSAQWTIGDQSIQFLIHFEYDRRKNDKECFMKVVQWISDDYEKLHISDKDVDINSPFCKGVYEKSGKFSELTDELKNFLYENLKIHGVEL